MVNMHEPDTIATLRAIELAQGTSTANPDTTSITDLIDNVLAGKETDFRLGETQLDINPYIKQEQVDDDDCD